MRQQEYFYYFQVFDENATNTESGFFGRDDDIPDGEIIGICNTERMRFIKAC